MGMARDGTVLRNRPRTGPRSDGMADRSADTRRTGAVPEVRGSGHQARTVEGNAKREKAAARGAGGRGDCALGPAAVSKERGRASDPGPRTGGGSGKDPGV